MAREQDDTHVPEPDGSVASDEVKEELAHIEIETDDEFGEVGAAKVRLQKIKDELACVKKERQEYLDGWQRCKADSVNARKEAALSIENAKARAREDLIESLLPVLDSFDMAMQGGSWQKVEKTWRVGVESIRGQLISTLENTGVTTFGKVGEQYDVFRHQAVQEVEGDGAPGTIARVVRSGWRTGERIIRPAEVVVFGEKLDKQ